MAFRTIDALDPKGKRVLVRADLNVPVKDGKVTDATRIERLAPTIARSSSAAASVIVMSHFGRPKGKRGPVAVAAPACRAAVARRSAGPCVSRRDCVGPEAERVVGALQQGEIALLEKSALPPRRGEERPGLRPPSLATLGDVYVDDAFSAAHRAHASIAALAHLLPAAAGKNMQAELEALAPRSKTRRDR